MNSVNFLLTGKRLHFEKTFELLQDFELGTVQLPI